MPARRRLHLELCHELVLRAATSLCTSTGAVDVTEEEKAAILAANTEYWRWQRTLLQRYEASQAAP